MSERIISEWSINDREKMRVRLDTYQGHDIIDLRRWFSTGGDEYRPGRGLTISVRHLPTLTEALHQALVDAKGMGLLDGGAK
jgi:transcriptional coactivator p15 (PC4)